MNANTISIITTSLNQGEFISETIDSVITQSGDFFIDYIIMDGGSTDQTIAVIRQYEENLSRNCSISINHAGLPMYVAKTHQVPFIKCNGISFRWFSARDNGQVDALKNGFKLAYGEILCWLNSDDIFLNSHVLFRVAEQFSSHPFIDIVTGDGVLMDRQGKHTGVWHVDKINLRELLFLDYHILQPSTFFRREIYHPEKLQEKYVCAFDADFFIHLIKGGHRVMKLDDQLSAFRIYPEIKTVALSKTRFRESIAISWSYSHNLFFLLISIFYKIFFILYKPRYYRKGFLADALLGIVYKFSYFAITGHPDRPK